jgi:Membrane protease subunits, stomatin/prohibitin homologs
MNRIAVALSASFALILILLSCVFVVDQRQYALVFALGEIKTVINEPGLHFKLPPPFQNVVFVEKRTLTIDNPDSDRFITSEKRTYWSTPM